MESDFQSGSWKGDAMHIDSASLLTDAALIAIGVLAVGFLLWFLLALTLEKNGAHVRYHMKFEMNHASANDMDRQPIREAAFHSRSDMEFGLPDFAPRVLVTHRAVRAVALTPERDLADEPWQARPYFRPLKFIDFGGDEYARHSLDNSYCRIFCNFDRICALL